MRKIKITLKPDSQGKKFYLFPSVEALYVWASSAERGETIHVDNIEEIVLEPGGYIEAELMGYEYIYESAQKHRKCDLVRLGLAHTPKNASGTLVTIHGGWVLGGLLPMKHYSDSDIEVVVMDETQSKIDLATLFNDQDDQDDQDVVDVEFEKSDPDDDDE